jgi:hypothetical protein
MISAIIKYLATTIHGLYDYFNLRGFHKVSENLLLMAKFLRMTTVDFVDTDYRSKQICEVKYTSLKLLALV